MMVCVCEIGPLMWCALWEVAVFAQVQVGGRWLWDEGGPGRGAGWAVEKSQLTGVW